MTWLFVGLFAATFVAIAVASSRLMRDTGRAAERELLQAAQSLGLLEQPRNRWTGERSFRGAVDGVELSWRLTPQAIGRSITVRVSHPRLRSEAVTVPPDAALTIADGFIELSFTNKAVDAAQLVQATQRLLAVATHGLG